MTAGYVMLSRPRGLSHLKSVGMDKSVREIIEQGPPEDLVTDFKRLFQEKIAATKTLAVEAARRYGLLPEATRR